MDCYYCSAKNECSEAVQPGSVVCLINQLHHGGTKANVQPIRQPGEFCQFCGQKLKTIGRQRFCANPCCINRFRDV